MLSPEELFKNKCDFLDKNFLYLCASRSVLEIGSFEGEITEHILSHQPSSLTLVEASQSSINVLRKKFPSATVIWGDMHLDLDRAGLVEVAVLLGVIYHSHAPLFVLEQLVYYCRPQLIILDNMSKSFGWHIEIPNVPGMRYTLDSRPTCNIVINISNEIIITAMQNLGYDLIKQMDYPENARAADLPVFAFARAG